MLFLIFIRQYPVFRKYRRLEQTFETRKKSALKSAPMHRQHAIIQTTFPQTPTRPAPS